MTGPHANVCNKLPFWEVWNIYYTSVKSGRSKNYVCFKVKTKSVWQRKEKLLSHFAVYESVSKRSQMQTGVFYNFFENKTDTAKHILGYKHLTARTKWLAWQLQGIPFCDTSSLCFGCSANITSWVVPSKRGVTAPCAVTIEWQPVTPFPKFVHYKWMFCHYQFSSPLHQSTMISFCFNTCMYAANRPIICCNFTNTRKMWSNGSESYYNIHENEMEALTQKSLTQDIPKRWKLFSVY